LQAGWTVVLAEGVVGDVFPTHFSAEQDIIGAVCCVLLLINCERDQVFKGRTTELVEKKKGDTAAYQLLYVSIRLYSAIISDAKIKRQNTRHR
jgi:hypothetical protein